MINNYATVMNHSRPQNFTTRSNFYDIEICSSLVLLIYECKQKQITLENDSLLFLEYQQLKKVFKTMYALSRPYN